MVQGDYPVSTTRAGYWLSFKDLSRSESGDGLFPSNEAADPETFPLSVDVRSRLGR